MRLDCRVNQDGAVEVPSHDVWIRTRLPGFAVLLDGYKVSNCYLCDTETGEVEHFALDQQGKLRFDDGGNAVAVVEKGHVAIMLPRRDGTIEVFNPQPEIRS